jgi:sugar lactone lactonase YvrE
MNVSSCSRILPLPVTALAVSLLLGCGGGGSSDTPSVSPTKNGPHASAAPGAATASISVYAGSPGGMGHNDGDARSARFHSPLGIFMDAQGQLVITEVDGRDIRRVDPVTGAASTLGGTPYLEGYADGPLADATFTSNGPVAAASDGTLYFMDTYNGGLRKVTPQGQVVTLISGSGHGGGYCNGAGNGAASFASPFGLALDEAKGILYVADSGSCTIRQVNLATLDVSTLAGNAYQNLTIDGSFATAGFFAPIGIVLVDRTLYVGCQDTVRKLDLDLQQVTTVAGTPNVLGFMDGPGASALMNRVSDLCFDGMGHLITSEGFSNTCGAVIRSIDLASGAVVTLAGQGNNTVDASGNLHGNMGWADGTGTAAMFASPFKMVSDHKGSLYITDMFNFVIRKMDLSTLAVTTLSGTGPQVGRVDGPAAGAAFQYPAGLAVDGSGNTYVADCYNYVIRKITPDGMVSTLAGNGTKGYQDGPGAQAEFNTPTSVGVAPNGYVYVADMFNSVIRKIAPDGTVSVLAGTPGISGYQDGAAATAQFRFPSGLAVAPSGDVYVADTYNNAIRKIAGTDGTVSTIAGEAAGFKDGLGANASFNEPTFLAVDVAGNRLIVADTDNNAIRAIDLGTQAVTTLAGYGIDGSVDGQGKAARFTFPYGVAVDPAGFILVCDQGNNAIRRLDASGNVTTVVGTFTHGNPSWMGITLGALPGQVTYPWGITQAPDGSYLVSSDNCILKITGIQ